VPPFVSPGTVEGSVKFHQEFSVVSSLRYDRVFVIFQTESLLISYYKDQAYIHKSGLTTFDTAFYACGTIMTILWQQEIIEACDQELWQLLGLKLYAKLDKSIRQQSLVEDYYLPLFFHLYYQATKSHHSPLIVGINAPQGGGKSTLTSYLIQLFGWCDLRAVTLSIDDFYLAREDQLRLAAENPENIYLQQRGYPGTHDIELGFNTLATLKSPKSVKSLALPRYDKSKHQGQGDRTDKDLWPETPLPVDIVLLEGWMLGFHPLPSARLEDSQMIKINTLLENYQHWHRLLDSFIYICPEDPEFFVEWRSEAEARMKAQGLPGMSADEVRNYAKKFLPAYRLYGPHLLENPPTPQSFLKIVIGKNRLPISHP
jgi:D-glycerate 3-kinase